ncbi:MAG TPA: HIT family protein [Lichenihabitans sp.]|jgi:histidine triad (HIT) family protein|nr:HIT family protein [Lichenihabitans sp.]
MPAYDRDNIFAKILRGEVPCQKVYEDEVVLAFMDVMPRVPGHLLVVPKVPARNLLDVPPEALAAVMPRVQKVAAAAVRALEADGLMLQQFNEEAGGQTVFHLHFHILPLHHGAALKPPGGPMEKPEVLAEMAGRIRAALAG